MTLGKLSEGSVLCFLFCEKGEKLCGDGDDRLVQCLTRERHTGKPVF